MVDMTMQWKQLFSIARFLVNANGQIVLESPGIISTEDDSLGRRSAFHIDHDRVVFSSAFRRLGRKTQVHPLAQHDHTHNRLTHSVEVASVGRSLGNRVGAQLMQRGHLPDGVSAFDFGDVVQVACLAHDIGNPPFGHTGEEALRNWFNQPEHHRWLTGLSVDECSDITTYEGNAHSLRMLTSLEMHTTTGGMRLTAASIGSLVKYPWISNAQLRGIRKSGKFNVYQTELAYFRQIASALGLIDYGEGIWSRHPLSYLMEAADDICYAILDLEDAVEMGILQYSEFEQLLYEFYNEKYRDKWPYLSVRQKCSILRSSAINSCIKAATCLFIQEEERLLSGEYAQQHEDLLQGCEQNVRDLICRAKALAKERIYLHRSKLVTELAAYPCLGSLLTIMVPTAYKYITDHQSLTNYDKKVIRLLDESGQLDRTDTLYTAYMKILDYLGSMTDNAAATLAREVSGVGIL